jgi:hypothetical protein
MVKQILPNNNEKCYKNFSPKIFTSKHALNMQQYVCVKAERFASTRFENNYKWLHDSYDVFDHTIMQQLNSLASLGNIKMKPCNVGDVLFMISFHS